MTYKLMTRPHLWDLVWGRSPTCRAKAIRELEDRGAITPQNADTIRVGIPGIGQALSE